MDSIFLDYDEKSADVNSSLKFFEMLLKIIITATKSAEKNVGVSTSNGLLRGYFIDLRMLLT